MKLNLPFELVVLLCAFWEVWRQHTVFVAGNLGRQVWLEQYETQVAIGEREIEQFVDCNNRCVWGCVCVLLRTFARMFHIEGREMQYKNGSNERSGLACLCSLSQAL